MSGSSLATSSLPEDGVDYVPGKRGYRMLTASFVTENILRCASDRLVYLAIHCHGGSDSVGFSSDDFASHERGYPALLDLADGLPVGALVFASNAVAGDIWLPGGRRVVLDHGLVAGRPQRVLHAQPPRRSAADAAYDRQARLFGDRGQEILRRQKVGIIGAGGAGSLIMSTWRAWASGISSSQTPSASSCPTFPVSPAAAAATPSPGSRPPGAPPGSGSSASGWHAARQT